MAKKSLITLGGLPGSGKSTVRRILIEKFGYATFSTGDMMRSIAADRGMTLEELNHESSRNKDIDLLIDEKMIEIEKVGDHMIVDSILGYHFVPSAFHVFLSISLEESARRILSDRNAHTRVQSGDIYETLEEAEAHIKVRIHNHQERYKKHYGLDPYNTDQYDLVVDTGKYTPAEVANIVIDAYEKWQHV